MFDIGFPELVLVSIIALLVIGPERLPETIRTLSLWIGRFRRSLANIKAEIESEIGADEIRQQLHNEGIMKELEQTRSHLDETIRDTSQSISDIKSSVHSLSEPSSPAPDTTPSDPVQAPSEDAKDSAPGHERDERQQLNR